MTLLVNIEGKQGLVRDVESGAILNIDRSGYENYLQNRQKRKKEKELLSNQTELINKLTNEVDELKQLVSLLLNAKKDSES